MPESTLLKKRLWHWCFPVNFAKFLRTVFHRTPLGDCFFSMPMYDIMRHDQLNNIILPDVKGHIK